MGKYLLVETILDSMSNVKKPQRKFISALFAVLVVFQGKANFRNMSRYSSISEKCFSRWYRHPFDFSQFNTALLLHESPDPEQFIAAIDASFLSKSGKKTQGLAWYYNGAAGEAQQTLDEAEKTRVDLYAEHLVSKATALKELGVKHIAADAYYSKTKFVSAVTKAGFELVGKLRVDANMKWLYEGDYAGTGRPRRLDGKVDTNTDMARFEEVESWVEGGDAYTAVLYSTHLKRNIRVVLLKQALAQKTPRGLFVITKRVFKSNFCSAMRSNIRG
ncbi:hypothetical protein [Granulosicoccus antarcticus]|uniref:Transposase IS701-like DDE domain-containing protein n=1 Tax=Granulosicoccus antarcticus IMCC3135 TaxID=1192854 RepID=A0A2Z2PA74_9GAMM|nr:hypothetical protein [Granulosicoccus antarcticus]ASJ76784.1 hypothetical protein IMCC3135_33715 [Granulosicoccus antarcticus IMCC3135]